MELYLVFSRYVSICSHRLEGHTYCMSFFSTRKISWSSWYLHVLLRSCILFLWETLKEVKNYYSVIFGGFINILHCCVLADWILQQRNNLHITTLHNILGDEAQRCSEGMSLWGAVGINSDAEAVNVDKVNGRHNQPHQTALRSGNRNSLIAARYWSTFSVCHQLKRKTQSVRLYTWKYSCLPAVLLPGPNNADILRVIQ